jgi:hypothetical protein
MNPFCGGVFLGVFGLNDMDCGMPFLKSFAATKKVHNVNHVVLFGVLGHEKRLTIRKSCTNCKTVLEIHDQPIAPNKVHSNQNRHQHRRVEPIFSGFWWIRKSIGFKGPLSYTGCDSHVM